MRVLVLDGDQNQAVACVRSLARQGHSVLVGESRPWSKAGCSRYSSSSFQYPSPTNDPKSFVDKLLREAAKERGTLVLPLTEFTTLLVSHHRDDFQNVGARFVLPHHGDLLRAVDKSYTTNLAQSLGIAVPKSCLVTTDDDAAAVAQQMAFPLVLKPRSSQEHSSEEVKITGRPKYVRSAAEFMTQLADIRTRCSAVLVQEFVEGTGTGYFALMNHGQLRAEFAHRRIRDVHPTGSGSALRESIAPTAEIRDKSLALLRALNWHGVAMIEYRLRPDGVPVFLEINGRFWHSLALPCYAGCDFPALLARLAEFGEVETPPPYKLGVRCRWLVGDFRHVVEVWAGPPPGYPVHYPRRLATLVSELIPRPGTFHDNFMWTDPLPEIADWVRLIQQVRERSF